jgi:TolB-like protein/Flp pilus assembly protein TadD
MSLLAELRRRNVLRAGVLYVGAVWALAQGIAQLAPVVGAPEWLARGFLIAAAVGFPFWIAFSWIYELTPQGLRRGSDLATDATLVRTGGRTLDRWIIAVLTVALVLLLTSTLAGRRPAAPDAGAAPGSTSIAVLPLSNESGDRDQQYFSDGLSEDLITALSQFAGLKVISRNSSFQFRGSTEDSRTIGEKLGVAHLLEGSVRRAGDVVRISAALVNAADGSTLWSQRYDRPYRDLFTLQDDITGAVASALRAKLLEGQGAMAQSDRPPSGNLEAWNAFSRARFHAFMTDPDDIRKAIGFYGEAIALDPRYARAHAGLSLSWTVLGGTFLSGADQRQAFIKARAAADRALELDPGVAMAHAARGLLLQWADFDWSGAGTEYRRALELAPTDGLARFNLGRLIGTLGRPKEASQWLREAIASDPRNSAAYYWLAWNLAATGDLDEAERTARKAVELAPGMPFLPTGLAVIQIQRGAPAPALATAQLEPPGTWRDIALALASQAGSDRAAADAALAGLIARGADGAAYQVAEVYGLRRDPERMFEWLDRAWDTRDSGISRLLTDPFVLPYRADPRFAAFCRKVGLPSQGATEPAPGTARSAVSAAGAAAGRNPIRDADRAKTTAACATCAPSPAARPRRRGLCATAGPPPTPSSGA